MLRAGGVPSDDSREALAILCQSYWFPIYAFVRRRGNNHHDAVDLTQGFFAYLIERSSLAKVDPLRGRFRAFLLASVKNYMSDEWRKESSMRRGGGMQPISVEAAEFDQRYQRQLTEHCTPDVIFEKSWVESLLACVLEQLRLDYEQAGKPELFEALRGYLVASADKLPQADIAARLGISVPAVTMSVQRIRQRYANILRQEIASTLADPADVEDELMRLKEVMSS